MTKYTKYKKEHYFKNQKMVVDGIPINPNLRVDFDYTPNDEREDSEINDWWNKPYIEIDSLEQEPWIEHYLRLKNEAGWSDEKIGTQEEWERTKREQRENWYKYWETGFRYNVRCLDGGAWDRSTNKDFFSIFIPILSFAKEIF